MAKIAGLRIGHDALEHALSARGIKAAVVGDDRCVLAAYASTHPEEEIRRILVEASGLAPFHIKAEAVDTLPRPPPGKTDNEQLTARTATQRARAAGGGGAGCTEGDGRASERDR